MNESVVKLKKIKRSECDEFKIKPRETQQIKVLTLLVVLVFVLLFSLPAEGASRPLTHPITKIAVDMRNTCHTNIWQKPKVSSPSCGL